MTIDRYQRQVLLPQIGPAGQKKLGAATVLLVGCGALGSTIAEQLVRAGVGRLRMADRDIVELTNLQRQTLFDETDVQQGLPKAVAAAQRLATINSAVTVEPRIVDVDSENIETLATGVSLILDGTDNVATRYLLNDVSVKHNVPWIYGACVGTEGRMMVFRPPTGPCMRCIFPQPPEPSELPTCDTAGVLGPVAAVVGSLQSIAAIKLLTGKPEAVADEMLAMDLWSNRIHSISTAEARRPDCPTCQQRRFEYLQSIGHRMVARLCGQNAVQLRPGTSPLSIPEISTRLRCAGTVQTSSYMVRCILTEGGLTVTAFEDGRVIVQGTADPARAKSIVARYLGA